MQSGPWSMEQGPCDNWKATKAHQGKTKQVTSSGKTQPNVVLAMLAR